MTGSARALVALSAALAAGDRQAIAAALDAAAAAAAPAAVEEALLQSLLFLGYPRALNALAQWRERSGIAAPAATQEDADAVLRRGEAVCERVYGGQYERLRENIARLHPDAERWMVRDGYGRVLGRPGLDLATRELCIVALLAGQDAAPQLYAHLRGALNAGASAAEVRAALALGCAAASPERAAAALETWERVERRLEPENGGGA